ncbi:hypothetical protein ACS0TY_018847 [Phlomoides rotata]
MWSYWWYLLIKHVGTESWFYDNISRVVGNGECTKFWKDKWIGGNCPKDMFPRLFSIDNNPFCSVADSREADEGLARGGSLGLKADQRRNLLGEFSIPGIGYKKSWKLYQLGSARDRLEQKCASENSSFLVENDPGSSADHVESVATRVCGNFDEDTKHLFFDCHLAIAVWKKVLLWFDIGKLRRTFGKEHLKEFVKEFRGKNKSVANIIWQCTTWNFWIRRNLIIFSGKNLSDDEVFEKICLNSFAWLKNRNLIHLETSFLRLVSYTGDMY